MRAVSESSAVPGSPKMKVSGSSVRWRTDPMDVDRMPVVIELAALALSGPRSHGHEALPRLFGPAPESHRYARSAALDSSTPRRLATNDGAQLRCLNPRV
jgi:hypothetical protein